MSERETLTRRRILMVADEWPWPADTGYRQRLDHVARALSTVADLDYVGFLADTHPDPHVPDDATVSGTAYPVGGRWVPGLWRRLLRWLRTGDPWVVSSRDWRNVRAKLDELATVDYDLVWFSHCDSLVALGDRLNSPREVARVLDVDNVPTVVLRSRLRACRRGWGVADWLRCALDVCDEPRWRAIERTLESRADQVVVCSELDRLRAQAPHAVLIPNGYTLADRVQRQQVVANVVTMVGSMAYEPNRDGAFWFVDRVLPILSARIPDIQVRIIGSTGGRTDVRELGRRPGVEVTGHVDDVTPYLAQSAVVIAPIRFGGGTRIKILEGFAHRVPVVATRLGCEGLDVQDGTHLLVADTPDEFAAACGRLLGEPVLAHRIARAAHDLYETKYRWELIREDVADVAARVMTERAGQQALEAEPVRGRALDPPCRDATSSA